MIIDLFRVFQKMFSWISGHSKKNPSWTEDAIGFEDVQDLVKEILQAKKGMDICEEGMEVPKTILITTIPSEYVPPYAVLGWKEGDELPLIRGTLDADEEEELINGLLSKGEPLDDIVVIVYGRNGMDESVMKKVKDLRSFGFENVYGYLGGMFEWCLLSDIYGDKEFPIVGGGKKVDPLFYKGERSL